MADFFQHGLIATIHDLGTIQRERIERMLERFAVNCRVGTRAARDGGGHAWRIRLRKIMEELVAVRYMPADRRRPGGGATADDYREAVGKVRVLGDRARCAVDGRPTRAGLVPTIERGGPDGDDAGQGPVGVDRVRISAGRSAAGGLCPARLRHRQLRPRNAGPAVPALGPSQPGLRVLQGVLRAGHRSHARPRRAIAGVAAAAGLDLTAGIRSLPGLLWRASAIRCPASLR